MTFVLTFIFMILVFWRPQEWLIRWMYGWPVLDVIVAVSLVTFFLEVDQGRLKFPKKWPQFYLLIGLWVAAMMSHVWHTYWGGLMETIFEVFKVCFFTALLFCVLDKPSRLRAVAIAFVGMACLMTVHALMQEKTGHGFAGQIPLYYGPDRQILPYLGHDSPHYLYTRSYFFGIFQDPNDLAQTLAMAIPFAFVLVKKRFWGFVIGCFVTWFLVRGIMATHSRGGYIALAVTSVVMVMLMLPPRWMPYLAAMLLLGGLVACVKGSAFMDESAYERIVYWGWANQAFKEQPIFGLGYGMFWQVYDRKTAHNAFVLCYTTLGIFGYWFWFLLIQTGLVGAWRARIALAKPANETEAWMRRFAGCSMASMAGFCAAAYFLSRTFVYPLFFLMATVGAVGVVTQEILPEDHPPLITPRKDVYFWGTLGVLASVVYIYVSIIIMNRGYHG